MSNPQTADFAAREAQLSQREAAIAAREAAALHDDNLAFAESLVADGRLLPASRDRLAAILDALPGHDAVSFAEGEPKVPAGRALRDLLQAQPKVVSFGRVDLPGGPEGARPASFAADGAAVDPVALALHDKAMAHIAAHPGTDYLAAVRAVS